MSPEQIGSEGRTSGLAITSLVLSILGFCTGGVTALVGLILGIVALTTIGKPGGPARGRGMAIGGIAVGAVGLVVAPIVLLVALLLPALSKARESAREVKATMMLRTLGQASMAYAADNSGQFPVPAEWDQLLTNYVSDPAMFSYPDQQGGRIYAMNERLLGTSVGGVGDPPNTVVLFEIAEGGPLAGGSELITSTPRNRKGMLVLFADGSVRIVQPHEVSSLVWEP